MRNDTASCTFFQAVPIAVPRHIHHLQSNRHLVEISGRHMWQDTDKTDDLAINAVLFNRAIVGAGYGLIQFGKIREDWPILNLGYRAGKASFMITINPIFGRNGMF